MKRRSLPSIALTILFSAVMSSQSTLHAQTVDLVDGESIEGAIVGIEEKDGATQLRTAERSVALRDVLGIRFDTTRRSTEPFEIGFADGSRAYVRVVRGDSEAETITIESTNVGGQLELSIGTVRWIRPRSAGAAPPEETTGSDRVRTRDGASLDGVVLGIDEKGVLAETDSLGEIRLDWAQLQDVSIAALGDAPETTKTGTPVAVVTRDGSRVRGRLRSLGPEQITIATDHFNDIRFETSKLSALEIELGRLVSLSDRDPLEIEEGNEWIPAPLFDELYAFERDRRRDLDEPGAPWIGLTIGERDFARGLAVHSKSKLVYEIKPGDARFQTWIGLDRSARPPHGETDFASVVFRVLLDDEIVHDSGTFDWRKKAERLDIPLGSAKKLTLIVDVGAGLHVRDRATWGDARLVRD